MLGAVSDDHYDRQSTSVRNVLTTQVFCRGTDCSCSVGTAHEAEGSRYVSEARCPLHASSEVAVTMNTPIARSFVKIAMAIKPLDRMNEETRAT